MPQAQGHSGGLLVALRLALPAALGLALLAAVGCGQAEYSFPAEPLLATAERMDFDVNGDRKADFFCFPDAMGRITRIGYDRDGDGQPDELIDLDAIPARACRQLLLILDGFPYDVVEEFHDSGHLLFLHPPAVVIPPYPAMTDPALEDALGYVPCAGYEARFFDRAGNRVVGGTWDYLMGRNEPFVAIIDYRAGTLTDAFAYLSPRPELAKELRRVKYVWDQARRQDMTAYLVSSAGMGSRLGKRGQFETLLQVEQLIYRLYYESRGRVKVTLMADHGQTNVPTAPARLDEFLAAKGWRVTDSLRRDNDVVLVRFGLVTMAALWTGQPAKLADDLLTSDKVELASYLEGDAVVVAGPAGRAIVRSTDGKTFQYEKLRGDVLKLGALGEGSVDGRALLKATADGKHDYPDPLYRLWRGHHGLVIHPADVLVSLDDRYYNGAGLFAGAVSMASTHGGLNWRNSATIIMSSAGAIQGPLRSEDIPGVLDGLDLRRPTATR